MRQWIVMVMLLSLVGCQGGRETLSASLPALSDDDQPPALSVPPLQGFLVNPYLQNPGPHHMTVMFEPEDSARGDTMAVEYRVLGSTAWSAVSATPESINRLNLDAGTDQGQTVYAARLNGLDSNTTYEYRVITAAGTTPPMRFKSWPQAGDGVSQGRFIVISDIQGNNPDWLTRVFEHGVIRRDCDGDVLTCVERFAGIIITGDLVDDGDNITQWREEYFAVGDSLFRYLPQLMIIGNHDYALSNYLYYAAPPGNGSAGHAEEWYQVDYLNFRFLGMQSNLTVQSGATQLLEQELFFRKALADTRSDQSVNYLFMGIHAPCKSELWIPGESLQVCHFVEALERFSADTGIISGHLFGHTHGYSRGQSRDAAHLWMNAASAGGRIDDWGDYAQADYDEFESTWDEYGYSILEFSTRGAPWIRTERRTGGDDHADYADAFEPSSDRDALTIGGDNQPPNTPQARSPSARVNSADVLLQAAYTDPDGDSLLEAHWQLRRASQRYDQAILDLWGNETRARNEWFREDLNAGISVDAWRVAYLPNGAYCWRVRFRDEHWAWSPFSDDHCFVVEAAAPSANLIINGDAEAGIEGWQVERGRLEALNSLSALPALLRAPPALCASILPTQGAHWFALGGCLDTLEDSDAFDYSVASQSVDLSALQLPPDSLLVLELALRNASKWDVPSARLQVLDAQGQTLATAKPIINQSGQWLRQRTSLAIPHTATTARVELTGLRQDGLEGDAFFDDIRLFSVSGGAISTPLPKLSPGNGMAIKPKKDIPALRIN